MVRLVNAGKEEKAETTEIIVVYHRADADGKLGAAIAYRALGEAAFYCGLNYEKVSIEEFLNAFPCIQELHLVDYAFPVEFITGLWDKGIKVVLMDHHKGAVEDIRKAWVLRHYQTYSKELYVDAASCGEKAGCYLAWEYYFKGEIVPLAVALISVYDTWQSSHEDWQQALFLNTSLYHSDFDSSYNSPDWVQLTNSMNFLSNRLRLGLILEDNNVERAKRDASWGGTLRWKGLSFFALNSSGNSRTAEPGVVPEIHDAILLYRYSPKLKVWKIGLYHSDKLTSIGKRPDLSRVARSYGGGGHAGACGFTVERLPFDLNHIEPIS